MAKKAKGPVQHIPRLMTKDDIAVIGLRMRNNEIALSDIESNRDREIALIKSEAAEKSQPILDEQAHLFLLVFDYFFREHPDFFKRQQDRYEEFPGGEVFLRLTPSSVKFTRKETAILGDLLRDGRFDLLDLFASISKDQIRRHPEVVEEIEGIELTQKDLFGIRWGDIPGPKQDVSTLKKAAKKLS